MISEIRLNSETRDDDSMTFEERKRLAQGFLWALRVGHTGWMGRKKEYVNLMQVDRVNEHEWSVDVCIRLLHILAHGGGKDGWVSMSVREWMRETNMTEEELAGARESLREGGFLDERTPESGKKLVMRPNLAALIDAYDRYWAQW